MENSNDIIELLDELYSMVNEAWGVPLGNDKCIIEREKAIDIINTIKSNLPTSIAESKRLVQARDEFIGNAKREAENLRKTAEDEANRLVNQQEILKIAKARSEQIITDAENKTSQLKKLACDYVDQAISKAEETLNEALESVRKTQSAFKQSSEAINGTDDTQYDENDTDEKPEKNNLLDIDIVE